MLHTLLVNDQKNITLFYAKSEDTIRRVVETIESPNCNYKHIALDILRILIRNNNDLRVF